MTRPPQGEQFERALELYASGKFEESRDILQELLEKLESGGHLVLSRISSCHNALGAALEKLGCYQEALSHFRKALEKEEQEGCPDPEGTVCILRNLLNVHLKLGDAAEADQCCQRLIPLIENHNQPGNYHFLKPLSQLAGAYHRQGKPEQALRIAFQAQELAEKIPDVSPKAVRQKVATLVNLSRTLLNLMRLQDAEPFMLRLHALLEKGANSDPKLMEENLLDLIRVYHCLGQVEPMAAWMSRMLELDKEKHRTERAILDRLRMFVSLFEKAEVSPAAMPLYARLLEILEKTVGSEDPEVAATLYALGKICSNGEHLDQAEIFLCEALRIRNKRLGEMHADTAQALQGIVTIYYRKGLWRAPSKVVRVQ